MDRFSRRRWRGEKPKKRAEETALSRHLPVFALLRGLVILLFVILAIQLVRLQVIRGGEYEERAAVNSLREIQTAASRGLIYDRAGRPLVVNVPRFAAAIVPADLPERGAVAVYQELASLIDVPVAEIERKVRDHLGKENPHSAVVIKEGIEEETALILRELEAHVPGLKLLVEAQRLYTTGDLTAHLLGYVGPLSPEEYEELKGTGYLLRDRIGKAGVENVYETLLRGGPGRKLVEVDARGRELRVISERRAIDGANLVLSIDLELQEKTADVLREVAGGSDNAAAVVMNVRTGEILALVSLPTYDNNIFSQPLRDEILSELLEAPGKPLLNHAIAEMYQPGSTFKTVVGAAALQEGVAAPSTTIVSQGYITVANEFDPNVVYVFKDWAALGVMDFYRGLAMSSDVYFYYLAGGKADEGFRGLGVERLARYTRAFGLGSPTGIDLPGESAGLVPDSKWKEETVGEVWFVGDTYNFGIGQGYLSVTPLQLLTAVSAIANGGELLQPHLLKEVRDSQGNVMQARGAEAVRRVPVDPGYLRIIRQAMRQSVTEGVASRAQVAGLAVAGKTGTAEFGQPLPDGTHATHGWFVGFAPYDAPEIAVVVFIQRGGGGGDAAPAAARILDYFFNGSNLAQTLAEEGR